MMRLSFDLRLMLGTVVAGAALSAQVAPSGVIVPPEVAPQQPPKPATPPQPGQQPVQQPGQPGAQPGTQPQNVPATDAPRLTDSGAFIMPNASLTEMIDLLAKRLKINYILAPAARTTVSIFTNGAVKPAAYMPLLETTLPATGDAMADVGARYP